jgi:hypothetical protein
VSTRLYRFNLLVHDFSQGLRQIRVKPEHLASETRIEIETLRTEGRSANQYISTAQLFSSLSGVTNRNRILSWPIKPIFQYYLGSIEKTHKDGRAEL